jgi:hypothetical protein
MPKTALLRIILGSSISIIFVVFAGCGNSRDANPQSQSLVAGAAAKLSPDAASEFRASETAPRAQQQPAQVLTPVKQADAIPSAAQPITGYADSNADAPAAGKPLSLVAMEQTQRYGDQVVNDEPDQVNPLRAPPRPVAAVSMEAPATPSTSSNPPPAPKAQPQPTAKHPQSTTRLTDIPFDPIKENGKIFEGWTTPKVALVITGAINGYIEPCGCAGIDRMEGGMSRRFSMFKELRDKGWPVVGLDAGGMAKGFGREAEMKFQTMVEGMRKTGYDAVALGASDLHLPAGEIASVAANLAGQQSPFISANVGLFSFDSGMTSTYRVISRGGIKIGVTSVLGMAYQKALKNPDIELSDPAAAIEKVLPSMKKQADYLVLLANATRDETVVLAKKFPDFDVVVTSDGEPEPPKDPQKIRGQKTLFVEVGHKGQNAIVLGLYGEKPITFRYQRVHLDSRFPPSSEMKALMAAYQDQLKTLGFAGLGLHAAPQPQKETNGKFVGSAKCESCHEESYNIWKKSLHAKAYDTLAKLDPPRNFDPECLSCHVVGWNPANYFPYEGGFESVEKTPKLIDVGCEACHGPGEKHVAAESGSNEALMQKYRKAMVLTKANAKKEFCVSCHDGDNSPDFNFETYWPLVEHYETSKPDAGGQK